MSTLAIDSKFPRHTKVAPLSDAAFRLHVAALSYCAEHETDGFVPESEVTTLTKHQDKTPLIKELEAAKGPRENGQPLWRRSARADVTGWDIHDYLEWNESHAALEAKRKRDRARPRANKATDSGGRDGPQQTFDDLRRERDREGIAVESMAMPSSRGAAPVPSHLVGVSNGKQSPDPDPSGDPDGNSHRAKVGGRGATIPEDWTPSAKDLEFAKKRGWDDRRIAEEAVHFQARHLARGTISKSWAHSWITWVIQGNRFDRMDGRASGVQRAARPGPARAVQPAAPPATDEDKPEVYR